MLLWAVQSTTWTSVPGGLIHSLPPGGHQEELLPCVSLTVFLESPFRTPLCPASVHLIWREAEDWRFSVLQSAAPTHRAGAWVRGARRLEGSV